MEILTAQNFVGVSGNSFELLVEGSALALTLVQVRPLAVQQVVGLLRQPFSLLFKSASQILLPQRIYPLRNATLGSIEMFLVPVARDQEGVTYQAIFH